MSNLGFFLKRLRIVSLFLFILSAGALLGVLVLNNYLVHFKFDYQKFPKYLPDKTEFLCNEKNDYCYYELLAEVYPLKDNSEYYKSSKLDQCNIYDGGFVVLKKF